MNGNLLLVTLRVGDRMILSTAIRCRLPFPVAGVAVPCEKDLFCCSFINDISLSVKALIHREREMVNN